MPEAAMVSADKPSFAHTVKSSTAYLDVAANTHGAEKGMLMHRALQRIEHRQPRVVEVGPGGGAAVAYLAATLASAPTTPQEVRLTLDRGAGTETGFWGDQDRPAPWPDDIDERSPETSGRGRALLWVLRN